MLSDSQVRARRVDVWFRKGRRTIIGFSLFGLAAGLALAILTLGLSPQSSRLRLSLSFEGLSRGEYPDGSKFSPEDLRSPELVLSALQARGGNSSPETVSKVRRGISVLGIIPPSVVKERDRIRASGQVPPAYVPDEYEIVVSTRNVGFLSTRDRELFLNDLVSAFQEEFTRVFASLPDHFGRVFESLKNADYFDYELILNEDMTVLRDFLARKEQEAGSFRSRETDLSFSDLSTEVTRFSDITENTVLSLINSSIPSRERDIAIRRMDYQLTVLGDQVQRLKQEESVVHGLLEQTEERGQNYVLGLKMQNSAQHQESAVVDQTLIDSLLKNDSYNFLVRKDLDAGIKTKDAEARLGVLAARRKQIEMVSALPPLDRQRLVTQVDTELSNLKVSYQSLLDKVRDTYGSYTRSTLADAVRLSQSPVSDSPFALIAIFTILVGVLGGLLGTGFVILRYSQTGPIG